MTGAADDKRACPRCGTPQYAASVGKFCPRCALEGAGASKESETSSESNGETLSEFEGWKTGTRIGDYELIDVLGQGGMAIVYLARQISLDRLVALKTVSAMLAADSHGRERFRREARAVAQLEHPRIVSIHDIARAPGRCITRWLHRRAPIWPSNAGTDDPTPGSGLACEKVAEAIEHAHQRGVLHRDLKRATFCSMKRMSSCHGLRNCAGNLSRLQPHANR